jgi:Holliday junction resolvase RusA-like endonuclease
MDGLRNVCERSPAQEVKDMIKFHVPGLPVAQPRQRQRVVMAKGRAFATNYTPRKDPVNEFKAAVRLAGQQAGEAAVRQVVGNEHLTLFPFEPIDGPVAVTLLFLFPRPTRLRWKKRPMPREPHTSKPDIENLAKAVLDALKSILFLDDAQVCRLVIEKHYAAADEPVGVHVEVWRVE